MKTMRVQESTKTETDQFELIKGVFSPDEALEVITPLIKNKINFHNVRNFSLSIRYGSTDAWSQERIKELTRDKAAIKALLEKAKEEGKTISINSNITIEVI
jgi:hypothetical protein